MDIGIFGLGITGLSVYKTLIKERCNLICYDDNHNNIEQFTSQYHKASIVPINNIQWTKLNKIVISPGVLHSNDIFKIAHANDIQITSDIELFIERNHNSEFVFITGTNGKSTITALTGHILAKLKPGYEIGGNIGAAVMSLPYGKKGYILEVSSFQIELLNKINPKISVISNITPDHLDRYETVLEYTKVKEKIFVPDSLKIIGVNSEISKQIYDKYKYSDLIPVSTIDVIANGVFCNDNYLEDNYFDRTKYKLPALPHLQGPHNKENIGISYAITRALGAKGESIIESLTSFKGLRHRMEYVGKSGNLIFYNDSKATNISSALSSLTSFKDIIWFAGGRFKEDNLNALAKALENIRKAYLFGESRYLFAEFLDNKIEYEICENLEDAFAKGINEFFNKNESVGNNNFTFLLAPACASYDQFKNFTERGDLFVKLAKKHFVH